MLTLFAHFPLEKANILSYFFLVFLLSKINVLADSG